MTSVNSSDLNSTTFYQFLMMGKCSAKACRDSLSEVTVCQLKPIIVLNYRSLAIIVLLYSSTFLDSSGMD